MLYEHQKEIVAELERGKRYIVAAPRTGKTRPVISYLGGGNVLVLTKKAAVSGWHKELKAMGVAGWTVTNYEQVRSKNWDHSVVWDHLVLDEAHSVGRYPKPCLVAPLIHRMRVKGVRVGLSATPCPESLSQLYHQAKCLKMPVYEACGTFYKFFRKYGVSEKIYVGGRMVETYKKCLSSVWEEFSECCCVLDRASAVPGFVEAVDHHVSVECAPVLVMHDEIIKHGVISLSDGSEVIGETAVARLQKAHQICGGTVIYGEDGESCSFSTHKLDWVAENIAGNYDSVVIFTQFKAEERMALEYFGVQAGQDTLAFNVGAVKYFVGQVKRFSEGVDLSQADCIVFLSMPWSCVVYTQARERLLRRDRIREAPVYFLTLKGGMDERVYDEVAVKNKSFTSRCYNVQKIL